MLLIYPPVARSPEPPLGIARLAGALRASGVPVLAMDFCAEGLDYLLSENWSSPDSSGALALKRRGRNAALLRSPAGYGGTPDGNPGRYRRAVGELGRALKEAGASWGRSGGRISVPSLADYREDGAAPTSRADLMAAAADFGSNIFFPLFERRLAEAARAVPLDAIGISLTFLSQALCAFSLIGFIRRAYPAARIILGGGLATSWLASGSLRAGDDFGGLVDAVIPGKGEGALAEYLGVRSGPSDPDFSDFRDVQYFSPVPILPYNFSWGCPWKRCTFCPERAEDSPYSGLRAAEVSASLARTIRSAGGFPGLFHFTDNEVAPLYLSALASEPPGAPWYGFARFSRRLLDRKYCESLAASGCVMLQLGLESADQAVLDSMGKGTRIDEIDAILGNLKASGIGVFLYVLFGTPGEDQAAALRTRDFIALRSDLIDFMNVAVFNLPIGGEDARRLPTKEFYRGDLSLYREFEHPAGWHRGRIREFLSRDFESLPEIRAILLRNPPVFTSSHAPFFLPRL